MPVVHAVYENGVFKPKGLVALPESCEVEFEPRMVDPPAPSPSPTAPNDAVMAAMRLGLPVAPLSFVSEPNLSLEEALRLLDEMAAMGSGQALPPDWSRADVYDDHD